MNTGCKIIDIEVRGESRIEGKEKIKKQRALARKFEKILNVRVQIIPLVICSLGAISKTFGKSIKYYICITAEKIQFQKSFIRYDKNIKKRS